MQKLELDFIDNYINLQSELTNLLHKPINKIKPSLNNWI